MLEFFWEVEEKSRKIDRSTGQHFGGTPPTT